MKKLWAALACAAAFCCSDSPARPPSLDPVQEGVKIEPARGNASTWHQILAAAANEAPELLLFTGDANDFGFVQDEWEAWFTSGQGFLERIPIMTVNGNHEANVRHYYAQFPLPNNQQWYGF